jgi:2-polyprenyl-3-methyl-5-hydroxy-6-metoxy-1,4-benzoquinol methylase
MSLKECIVCNNKETTNLYSTAAMMHHSIKEFNFFICMNCNLVFLNPRPSLKELEGYYTDFYLPYRGASAWGKYEKLAYISQKRLDAKRANLLKQYSSPNEASTILDVGCGNPTFLETCSKLFKSSLYGIDFSDNGWIKDKKRFKKLNLRVGNIDNLKENFSPDIITLWHYLEHDYYPNKTLKKLAEISQPKTKLYVEVPNYESLGRKKYKRNWAGFHTPRHTYIFSPNNIEIILNKNGWEVELIDLKGTLSPYILSWMSEMEIKKLDWNDSMESQFLNYFYGMIKYKLKHLFTNESEGIMTIIARKIN